MNLLIFLSLFTLTVSYIFEINEDYGVQMWEVHETINELVEINYEGPQSMTLDTNEVYIILSKSYSNVYKIFIWVGRNSSKIQRQNAAYNSVELFLLLKMYINADRQSKRQLSISREGEGQESLFLQDSFNCSYESIPKLYRVTGSRGQYMMQVPYTSTELNSNDSFLLQIQKDNKIIVWNLNDSDNEKLTQVHTLARHIQNFEKTTYSTEVLFYYAPTDEFLKQFVDYYRAPHDFFEKKIYMDDENLEREINESTILVEYTSISCSRIRKKEITYRPLTSSLLRKKKVYLLEDLKNKNIFVIKGSISAETLFASALQDAETAFNDMSLEDAWRKITIIEEAMPLPVDFLIHFEDVKDELKFQDNISFWF